MKVVPKEIETLWTLFTAPVLWAVHFLLCYGSFAVYCAKAPAAGDASILRLWLAAFTLVVLILIALSAYLAWRQWGFGTDDPPHDAPSRQDRTLFQGFATLLLSGLSFLAVVYSAMPLFVFRSCAP